MASRKKYDAVATVGEYTDKATGEKKKRYATVGTVFENEEGKLSLKLDTVPIAPGWSGSIQFFTPTERDQPRALPPGRRTPPGMPPAATTALPPAADDLDDLPF